VRRLTIEQANIQLLPFTECITNVERLVSTNTKECQPQVPTKTMWTTQP
jgi:hypothetical protein